MDVRRRVLSFRFPGNLVALSFVCTLAIFGCSSGTDDSALENSNNPVQSDAVQSDGASGQSETDGGAENENPSEVQTQQGDTPVTESPVPGGAQAITDLVLVTGQSNALGAETSYDPQRDVPHPRAFAYTDQGWQVADVIGFVLVTAPGEGIGHWDYESDFYVNIRERVVAALNDIPGKAAVDGILWHQGETDWAETDYYRAKLSDLIRNFRGESWFSSDRPFICGETARAPVNNILMALNNDGDKWTACVEGDDLPTFLDDYHFSAEGLRIIGTRYATKYIQLSEQP